MAGRRGDIRHITPVLRLEQQAYGRRPGLLCFDDATLRFEPDHGGRLRIKSAASNNFYSKLPYRLAWDPSAESVIRLRKFMATTYAGCAHGEYLDSCMDAL